MARAAILGAPISTIFATIAHAQSLDVVVMGMLTDATGAAIVATQEATGFARTAVTASGDRYLLLDLPAGTYTVRARPSVWEAQTISARQ